MLIKNLYTHRTTCIQNITQPLHTPQYMCTLHVLKCQKALRKWHKMKLNLRRCWAYSLETEGSASQWVPFLPCMVWRLCVSISEYAARGSPVVGAYVCAEANRGSSIVITEIIVCNRSLVQIEKKRERESNMVYIPLVA